MLMCWYEFLWVYYYFSHLKSVYSSGLPCIVGLELRSCRTKAPSAVGGGGGARPSRDSWGRVRLALQGACLPASYLAGGGEPGVLWLQREEKRHPCLSVALCCRLLLPWVLDQRSLGNHTAFLQTSTSPVSPSFFLGFRVLLSSFVYNFQSYLLAFRGHIREKWAYPILIETQKV